MCCSFLSSQDLLEAVLPFDLLLDRGKRANFLHNLEKYSQTNTKSKVVRDAGIALASLAVCEEALERELFISTSCVLLLPSLCKLVFTYKCTHTNLHNVYIYYH